MIVILLLIIVALIIAIFFLYKKIMYLTSLEKTNSNTILELTISEKAWADQTVELSDQLEKNSKSYEDGLAKQKGILFGKGLEKFLPYFTDFPYNPLDVIGVFDTIDFITCVGRNLLDNNPNAIIDKIIFQDVKYNTSKINHRQDAFRDAILYGRVGFEIWRIDEKTGKLKVI